MYCITDEQMEFILGDIRARGVETEDLQLNLLDHICCIIEQQLEENGDFKLFYSATVRKFYKDELREIEEETQSLLTNKNYYVMKKIMLYSGVFAAISLTAGIIFKYMHSPGASVLITLGIVTTSLIFIPLLFALKIKEKQTGKDKLLVGLGTLAGIAIALGILFKIQHWPGANILSVSSVIVMMALFLPIYFVSGIRNPETKVNTIVTSIIMVVGCGLFFSLTLTPRAARIIDVRGTQEFVRNEQILANEQLLLEKQLAQDSMKTKTAELSHRIFGICEDLKTYILETETGRRKISETDDVVIPHYPARDFFAQDATANAKLDELRKTVAQYNAGATEAKPALNKIPVQMNLVDVHNVGSGYQLLTALNDIIQIQMLVLQNEHALALL